MTDFVDDLERELLAAARRGPAPRRRLIPRLSLKPILAVATAVAATLVVAFAVDLAPEREAPVTTPSPVITPLPQPKLGDVLVLNETTIAGLASATRDQLKTTLGIQAAADTGPSWTRKRSVVHPMSPADEPLARRIAAELRLPVDPAAIPPVRDPAGRQPKVVVLLGSDRMR